MPSRPDLREIATNVRDAFADADRETLLDVLAFVVKEYVVEGPPPMLVHQAETLADLPNATFAQLIAALQTRFDHPELSMFIVDGEQVGVRIGGVVHPLLRHVSPGQPLGAAELPRPAAGVRVVEATLAQRAAGAGRRSAERTPREPPAPVAPPVPAPPAAASPAAPPAAAAPSDKDAKPGSASDDASVRFSLLELD